FLRATLNQVRATRLAMAAIRAVQPDAQLVQTEDLGRTHSTPALRYQATFENERRWLTFDLLTGRVGRTHAMYAYARWCGMGDGGAPGLHARAAEALARRGGGRCARRARARCRRQGGDRVGRPRHARLELARHAPGGTLRAGSVRRPCARATTHGTGPARART